MKSRPYTATLVGIRCLRVTDELIRWSATIMAQSQEREYLVTGYPKSDLLLVERNFGGVRLYPVNATRAPKVHALIRPAVWADALKRGYPIGRPQ